MYDRFIPASRLVFLRLFFREKRKTRCIFIREERYEVRTCWGWFSLDAGAWRDCLAGKLWITWAPWRQIPPAPAETAYPPDVTEDAVRLRDLAVRQGLYAALQTVCPGAQVDFPYRLRMRNCPIDELPLSVRSMNGLMRAGAGNFGRLWDVMTHGSGLRTVRNLGAKSETEIRQCFFDACFQRLTPGEQAACCQKILSDSSPGEACGPEPRMQDASRTAQRRVQCPQNT